MSNCKNCGGVITQINKLVSECSACKALYDENGNELKSTIETEIKDALKQGSDDVRTLFASQLILHGKQMWVDGFKEGLLLGMRRRKDG